MSVPPIQISEQGQVTTVTLHRPPHNFIDEASLAALADAVDALDADDNCRAIVLATEGRTFCAGADLSRLPQVNGVADATPLYTQALRLFRSRKPMVAAIQGAAIGAGAGLALVADFRVACPASRFSVNFNRLGFHPGFGLSCTLPRLVGQQMAARLFYLGERIDGERMLQLGLADELAADDQVLARAQAFAQEIALSAPLAVQSTRETLRQDLADQVAAVNAREVVLQREQFATQDFREGVAAAPERRAPRFTGR